MTTVDAGRSRPGQAAGLLTIGQLADYVGVTIRAVRHYHRRGLIPEPERDSSGYRRYDAGAVIELIRIKALADAGVPLARIEELLGAQPQKFSGALAEIDQALARRIEELQEQRRRISQLAAGDRLYVPPEIADLFERFGELGINPEAIQIERDGWILVAALSPKQISPWAEEKLAALADPDFRRLYLAIDEALDWDRDDPRLAGLVSDLLCYKDKADQGQQREPTEVALDPALVMLMTEQIAEVSPMWQRLDELATEQLRRQRDG